MTKEQNHLQDIAEIRSMMERSSKFLSHSGWAGIMAGIYALAGTWLVWQVFTFQPGGIIYNPAQAGVTPIHMTGVILTAILVLVLAIGTAIFLSRQKAHKKGERVWNATSRRLLAHMAVPLFSGGILILILWSKGLIGLMAPFSLMFYGIALYNAGQFTYVEIRYLGLIQIVLGLISSWFVEYGLIFWAIGFGVFHIIYGIYMHFKYER